MADDPVPPIEPVRRAWPAARVSEPRGKSGWRRWAGRVARAQVWPSRPRAALEDDEPEPERDRLLENKLSRKGKFLDTDA